MFKVLEFMWQCSNNRDMRFTRWWRWRQHGTPERVYATKFPLGVAGQKTAT